MTNKTKIEPSAEYQNMVDLLAVFSEATNQMAELEADLNDEMLQQMDERRAKFSKLQETIAKAEQALEVIVLKHDAWFEKRKSIVTPYGTVKITGGESLQVDNEELTMVLIEKAAEKQECRGGAFINTVRTLDLEALGKLDDETLADFRIKRVKSKNVKIAAAAIDLGKAMKEIVKQEAA
jgi:hypothetical protein